MVSLLYISRILPKMISMKNLGRNRRHGHTDDGSQSKGSLARRLNGLLNPGSSKSGGGNRLFRKRSGSSTSDDTASPLMDIGDDSHGGK
jgi:hypothetical protein